MITDAEESSVRISDSTSVQAKKTLQNDLETIWLARCCLIKHLSKPGCILCIWAQIQQAYVFGNLTYGFVFCSIPKHRIGTKRHRVCLEVPQEVSESEAFPKEELSSAQHEADMAEPPERPTSEVVQQSEQGLQLPGSCVSSFILVQGARILFFRERSC